MSHLTNLVGKATGVMHTHKSALIKAMAMSGTMVAMAVPVFAEVTPPAALPTLTITQDMLTPLVEGVIANISAILPVGLGLFAIMLGIRIIPSVLGKLIH